MRKTYRSHKGNKAYWEHRWGGIPADDGALNVGRYPGRFAEEVFSKTDGPVLEAGCGAGRVLLHYHNQGRDIVGMDFVETALRKIRDLDSEVCVTVADISRLPFRSKTFSAVLAFGLYHNLEESVNQALMETRRVMKPGGLLCASMRADNIQNRIVDWLANRRTGSGQSRLFHKANYTREEFKELLESTGFKIESMRYVENMPLLYKFPIFRHCSHRKFDEHLARGEGYRLSWSARMLQRIIVGLFPASFCNINIAIARAS